MSQGTPQIIRMNFVFARGYSEDLKVLPFALEAMGVL